MTKLKKWELLNTEDVSPSKYFPLEKRTYRRPDGVVIDDFYVTTLADSVHVIPITKDKKVVMIRMYKQGTDEFMIQFPAGRFEGKHMDLEDAAVKELEEEAGIKITKDQLIKMNDHGLMTTKATEVVRLFLVTGVEINSNQILDENEEIEVLVLTPEEVDQMILNGEIWCSPTIANWYLLKTQHPEVLMD
jgi:ADP-ribose pyrophosphatase